MRNNPLGFTCAYLLSKSMTLVDTGVNTSYAWQSLKNQIKKTGNELDDLEQVILTHLHQDHVGIVDKLKKEG